MTESAKLRLPYIAAAQAQKHVTHNEALTLLDTLVQASVIDKDLTEPPVSPQEGDTYIVAAGGSGAWSGFDHRIVRYIDGIWRSLVPGAGGGVGWLVYVIDEDALYVFNGAGWDQLFVAAASLDDLDDVDAPAPSDGDVLTFDEGNGAWIAAAAAGGGDVGGPDGGVADGEIALFDGTSGKAIKGSGGALLSDFLAVDQNFADVADKVAARENLKIAVLEESAYDALDPPDADTIYYVIADS